MSSTQQNCFCSERIGSHNNLRALRARFIINYSAPDLAPLLQSIFLRHCIYPFYADLDVVVSDKDIRKIAADYLVDWHELSPELGLKPADEIEISETFKIFGHQKREALLKWKKREGRAATYRALIDAAETINNKQLADDVREMKNEGKNAI